jgi:CubicO group peptidase (beta-lactamase class C family)
MFKALSSTYFSGETGPTIDDIDVFENRVVATGSYKSFPERVSYNNYVIDTGLMTKIESYEPIGLAVIIDETMAFEKQWEGYDDARRTNSFSVAKSIVGLAVLKAIDEGFINNLDQKVIEFVPELKGDYREDVTIRHLITMTSGIDFGESYGNPFGFMARAYYGDHLLEKTLSYEAEDEPGSEWLYQGGNTILLSIIVARSSKMNLSDFVSKYLWSKLGSPYAALWSLDDEGGMEKAYCCFYTALRDFGRLGLIINTEGYAFRERICDPELIKELKKPVVLNNGEVIPYYGYHWWRINYKGLDVVYARGILGQYVIAIPEYDMVVVRLGKSRGETDEHHHPADLYLYLELAQTIYDQAHLDLGSP